VSTPAGTGPVVVTGASGQVGRRVAARLAGRGVAQRLVVRDPERAPRLEGAEVAVADFADPAALRATFTGAGTLFLVSAAEAADRVGLHGNAVDAAVAAGVPRVVYLSFLAAGPRATFTFARDHWHTEQRIRAAGVPFTFLRDSLYQDMFPLFVGEDRVIRGPAGDGRVAAVARDDVADAAVAVLLDPVPEGRAYDLTGPVSFTVAEAAAAITEAAGVPVTYHAETLAEAYGSRARYGAPDWAVEGWVTSYSAIATGELDVVSDAVATLTGHPPMDLRAYLAANPDALSHIKAAG
jgi:NAD(P)H dehydrogenase (quinone)